MAASPPQQPRRSIKPKHLLPSSAGWRGADLAAKVTYVGSGKHKTEPPPAPFRGAWTPVWPDDGQTERCAAFHVDEWPQIEQLLRQAVATGFVAASRDGVPELRDGMPSRAWAFIDDVLHEARLTGGGAYHAFPLTVPQTWPIDREGRLSREDAPRWRRSDGGERREPRP